MQLPVVSGCLAVAVVALSVVSVSAGGAPSATPPPAPVRHLRPTEPASNQHEVHAARVDMKPIMFMLSNHAKVHFQIQDIRHGERTITTSDDPAIVRAIQVHAWEMKARIAQGNNDIRPNDPLFLEIFKHHREIHVQLRNLRNGVAEDETSRNPQVVLLIRAHARRVAGFVREGLPAARRIESLPPGYRAPKPK